MFSAGRKKSQIPPVEEGRADLLGSKALSSGRTPSQQPGLSSSSGSMRSSSSYALGHHQPPTFGLTDGPRRYQPHTDNGRSSHTESQSNRVELFRDARAPRESFGRGNIDHPDRYSGGESQALDEDDEVEAIKQQMRFTKQESLASTRNALRTAREAEETARNTLARLGDQSERIANTERSIDMAKAHNDRAEDEAKEIKALNRSIFRPNFNFNKQAKRDAAEQRIIDRHSREREDREEVRRQVFDSRERVGGAFRDLDRQQEKSMRTRIQSGINTTRITDRGRYTFEADQEDEDVENELDDNLNEISDLSKRLNLLARASGDEVRAQNQKLGQLSDKVDAVDTAIFRTASHRA